MQDSELLPLLRYLASLQKRIDHQLRTQQQELAGLHKALIQSRAALIASVTRQHWMQEEIGARAEPGIEAIPPRPAPTAVMAQLRRRQAPNVVIRNTLSALAADVVICRSGCLSHDAYWQVQEYCRRHGKRCVMVEADVNDDIAALLSLPVTPK